MRRFPRKGNAFVHMQWQMRKYNKHGMKQKTYIFLNLRKMWRIIKMVTNKRIIKMMTNKRDFNIMFKEDTMKDSVTSLPEFAPAPRTLPASKWQGSQDRPGRRTHALSLRSWCHQQRRALDRVHKGESTWMLLKKVMLKVAKVRNLAWSGQQE